jgi:acyl-coenzyme A synthetase/AMP-(fatty) acid ligase
LIQHFLKGNPNLHFVDAETGEHMGFSNILQLELPLDLLAGKKLVFLYLNNSLASIRLYIRLLDTNHALVLLNPELNFGMKEELENTYCPQAIFDSSESKRENGYEAFFFEGYRYWISNKSIQDLTIHPEIKLLLSTSGTTGSAKFVKLSEANLIANAQSIASYLPISLQDVAPLNLAVFYSYGLSVLHANCLKAGTIVCTTKDVMQRGFWEDLSRLGYTSLAGVPFVYEMLMRIGVTKKEYPSIRYFTQAGGKLADHLIEEFANYCRRQQKQFYVMYGQTEATARMSYLHPDNTLEKLGSIGKAIPNGRFEIDNATSELVYYGPNIFGGYAQRLQDLTAYVQPNQLRTGDLARIDEEGFYFITGRAKRFIKLFGIRTNLDEIEGLLKNHFRHTQFACTGNDEKLVIAFDTQQCPEQEVKVFLKENLHIHPTVIQIISMSDLPKTSNGKVDYTSIMLVI